MARSSSLYPDGLEIGPPPFVSSLLCLPTEDAEAELYYLFHQHFPNFLRAPLEKIPSRFDSRRSMSSATSLCAADHSELFRQWIQSFFYSGQDDKRLSTNPDLRIRIQALVAEILSKETVGFHRGQPCLLMGDQELFWGSVASGALKRGHDSLVDILTWLKSIATGLTDEPMPEAVQEWRIQILRARQALFLSKADASNVPDYPYQKRQRTRRFVPEASGFVADPSDRSNKVTVGVQGSNYMLNQPTRRSTRFLGMLKHGENNHFKKRIPIGSFFQAYVPEWNGPPNNYDQLDDERWLGTKIWPLEGDSTQFSESIGKGRPKSCFCACPGSVSCVKYHIETARLQLASDFGLAFSSLGFNEMGEEVSESWRNEEQLVLDAIIRTNPTSEYASFLEPASKAFPSKSKQSIVSYYFNVFIPRRMSNKTRMACGTIDSDDDGNDGIALEASYSATSQRRYPKKKT